MPQLEKSTWRIISKFFQTQFTYSVLGDTKDNIPQLAHVDMKEVVTEYEQEHFGIKSCIGFTPIHADGMMLQVWTEGKSKKYCTVEEVIEDDKRIEDDNEPKPGQYFLYIPWGIMIVLPGDTVHAGDFCFGGKEAYPSSVPGKEIFVQNGQLHFNFHCSQLAHDDINGEATITIVADNEPPYLRDFEPDEIILKSLFESVLDRHEVFVPIATYKGSGRGRKRRKKCIIPAGYKKKH